jgi:uncharacterized membrane protein YphA (DoxX/SURF4 family)
MSLSLSLLLSVGGPALQLADFGGGSVDLLVTGLQVLLGLLFVLTGGLKIVGVDEMVENFDDWGYPQWFRALTGLVEATGGILFIGGIAVSVSTFAGGALLGATMVGAIYTHAPGR